MNVPRKIVLLLLAVGTLAFICSAVYAALSIVTYEYPTDYTVVGLDAEIKIDNVVFEDGTWIHWTNVERGNTYTKTFSIKNTGSKEFVFSLEPEGFLPGVTVQLDIDNENLPVDGTKNGLLSLTVAEGAELGSDDATISVVLTPQEPPV